MTPKTADFFSAYAADFDALYGTARSPLQRFTNRYLRKSMRLRYEKTIAGCQPVAGKTVLDVGCGPGHYAITLAQLGASKVMGVDFAPAMIDLAREKAKLFGVAERCEFHISDIMTCAWPNRFDYVVVMGFMDYVAEPAALLAKLLSLTDRRAFFSFPIGTGVLAWQRQVRYRTKCPLFLYKAEEIERLFVPHRDFRIQVELISRDYLVIAERVSE